jgi:hypothetical protein
MAVKAYLRIATNVIWGRTRVHAWIRSWEEYIFESERLHVCLVESPFSPYPLSVRQVLAESNYLGNWMLLEHMVLPGLNVPSNRWSFFTFRWIMLAATHTVADQTGKIKQILGTSFDLSCLLMNPQLDLREGLFLQLDDPGEVALDKLSMYYEDEDVSDIALSRSHIDRSIFEDRCHDPIRHPRWSLKIIDSNVHYTIDDPLHDVLLAHLPQFEAFWLTQRVRALPLPQPDDECTICQDDFTTVSCVRTKCNHLYHLSCLHQWQESLQSRGVGIVSCCYCRRELMDTNALKRLEEVERKGVPLHLTMEQHKEQQKRCAVTFGQLF